MLRQHLINRQKYYVHNRPHITLIDKAKKILPTYLHKTQGKKLENIQNF